MQREVELEVAKIEWNENESEWQRTSRSSLRTVRGGKREGGRASQVFNIFGELNMFNSCLT